jgi:hypothetical protein
LQPFNGAFGHLPLTRSYYFAYHSRHVFTAFENAHPAGGPTTVARRYQRTAWLCLSPTSGCTKRQLGFAFRQRRGVPKDSLASPFADPRFAFQWGPPAARAPCVFDHYTLPFSSHFSRSADFAGRPQAQHGVAPPSGASLRPWAQCTKGQLGFAFHNDGEFTKGKLGFALLTNPRCALSMGAFGRPRPLLSLFSYHSGHVFRAPPISRAGRRPNESTRKNNGRRQAPKGGATPCRRQAPLGGATPMRNPLVKGKPRTTTPPGSRLRRSPACSGTR